MRIIAGKYRRRIIKSLPSMKIRPTSDRLRETLFNVLTPRISEETTFLDLCAGTGAVGIEALSSGVGFATFVDKSRRACILIEENRDLLEIPEDKTEIIRADASEYLRRTERVFDLIFYDPPYCDGYIEVLQTIGLSKVLSEEGILVVEHETKRAFPETIGKIRKWRLIRQGGSSLSFYECR